MLIIVVLLTFIIRYKNDIKYISKQIEYSKGEYTNIKISSEYKDVEDLAIQINDLYEKSQKINLKIRKNEEALRRSIANIAHDLRTPLTSVMGYLQLLNSDDLTNEDKKQYLSIIERRTKTLQSLINSFYELSRIESNDYKFNLKSVNINKLLCETIAVFYEEFTNKNIEPIINIDENIPSIIADENAVMRIFSNLINNMLKHGQDNIAISLKKEKDKIITEFTNGAPMLKKENLEHLFERTYTADATRNDKNTGLGLSIAKAFVEQLGHTIEAELFNEKLTIRIIWKLDKSKH
jgi:Signal transduction histidine kinase